MLEHGQFYCGLSIGFLATWLLPKMWHWLFKKSEEVVAEVEVSPASEKPKRVYKKKNKKASPASE